MPRLYISPLSIPPTPTHLSGGVLQDLPQLDQLHEPTSDQAADENARMNCVFTCNAAIARRVGRHPEANGDAIKDGCANYGQGYTGGAAEETVAADGCLDRTWGIHADTFRAPTRTGLLQECMQQADAGNFTIVTIPSLWGSQPSQPGYNPNTPDFWTHACVYCGYVGDIHYLMNPWGGFIMSYSFADLALRLCFLKVYPVRPVGVPMSTLPAGWSDDGTSLHNPKNAFVVAGLFRDYIRAYPGGWNPDNVPLMNAQTVEQTEYHATLGAGMKQLFLRTGLRLNPTLENKVMESDLGAEVFALQADVAQMNTYATSDLAIRTLAKALGLAH